MQTSHLYRRSPMVRCPGQGPSEVVYLPLRHVSKLVSQDDFKLLTQCGEFRRLDEHARSLTGNPHGPFDIEASFSRLIDAGLMISYEDVLQSCVRTAGDCDAGQISWVAVPTCDRLLELERAVRSYLSHFARFDRRVSILIADDSSSRARQQDCRRLVETLARESDFDFFYVGRKEKKKFAELLSKRGDIPRDVASFAMFGSAFHGPTIGANRNAVLLHTVDHLVLSVDDDTVCQMGRMPLSGNPKRLSFRNDSVVTETWPFETEESALEAAALSDVDLLHEHECLLGQFVPSLVRDSGDPGLLDVSQISDRLLGALYRREGRVAVTYNGIIGDTGMYSPLRAVVFAKGDTRSRFWGSKGVYNLALNSRFAVRHAANRTVCHGGETFATVIGLDNRGLLPPFQPNFRGEDHLFSRIVTGHLQRNYLGHVPFSVLHQPLEERRYAAFDLGRIRACEILEILTLGRETPEDQRPPREQLESLGQRLIEIGSIPHAEFRTLLLQLVSERAERCLLGLGALLRQVDPMPDFLRDTITEQMDHVNESRSDEHVLLASDLDGQFSPIEGLIELQRFVSNFGYLLKWWPATLEQARLLKKQGCSIGIPVLGA